VDAAGEALIPSRGSQRQAVSNKDKTGKNGYYFSGNLMRIKNTFLLEALNFTAPKQRMNNKKKFYT